MRSILIRQGQFIKDKWNVGSEKDMEQWHGKMVVFTLVFGSLGLLMAKENFSLPMAVYMMATGSIIKNQDKENTSIIKGLIMLGNLKIIWCMDLELRLGKMDQNLKVIFINQKNKDKENMCVPMDFNTMENGMITKWMAKDS